MTLPPTYPSYVIVHYKLFYENIAAHVLIISLFIPSCAHIDIDGYVDIEVYTQHNGKYIFNIIELPITNAIYRWNLIVVGQYFGWNKKQCCIAQHR